MSLALSSDGEVLLGGTLGGQIVLWDLQGEHVRAIETMAEGTRVGQLSFGPAGVRYLSGAFHEPEAPWTLWDAEKLEAVESFGPSEWIGVDGRLDEHQGRLLLMSADRLGEKRELGLYEITGVEPLLQFEVGGEGRAKVALTADGEVFAYSQDRNLQWHRVMRLAALPGDLAADMGDGAWGTELLLETEADGPIVALALPGAGEVLWGATADALWRWAGEGALTRIPLAPAAEGAVGAPIRALHVVERGREQVIAVSRPPAGGLNIYGEEGTLVGRFESGSRCEIHAISGDGKWAACGNDQAEVLWGGIAWQDEAP